VTAEQRRRGHLAPGRPPRLRAARMSRRRHRQVELSLRGARDDARCLGAPAALGAGREAAPLGQPPVALAARPGGVRRESQAHRAAVSGGADRRAAAAAEARE